MRSLCCILIGVASVCGDAFAQELTPRAYWPAPVGTDVLFVAYQQNSGDVVIDPSLPISGVDSDVEYFQVAYQRALDALGRSASLQVSQAYADGTTRGTLGEASLQRTTAGLGDTRIRFAINLKGAPAMEPDQFAALRQNPEPIVGASIVVQAPTGDYDPTKLINLGTNRWSVKPAVGMILPLRPTWLFEAEIGAWIFGDNDDFLGETRRQDDIFAAELHLIKRIRPGFWASFDANYYTGGETRVGDVTSDDLQRNSRAGFTVVFPMRGRHAIRGSYSTGVSTRSGGDFQIVTLSYLYAW
jgi:hypothetical protein